MFRIDRAVQTVTRPDGLTLTVGYDAEGRPETLTAPTGTTTWTYAPTSGLATSLATPETTVGIGYDGSLPTSITWTGAVAGSVGVTYDNFLRPSSQTVNGGSSVAFTYDADNLLTGSGSLTITRQPATGIITGTALSGVSESRTLNGFGEVTARSFTRSGSTLYSASYTRDALARIESKTETVGGTTHVEAYSYDPAGRLQMVTRDGILAASYDYDANGNRTSTTTTAGTTTATYDAQDRLQQWSDISYTYTAAGELLTKTEPGVGTTGYTYDVQGNLRQVALPTGTVIQYQVDALNRRIGRLVNGVRTHGWLWAGTLRPVAELDGVGNLVSRFVYGTGVNVPDYLVRGGQTYRLITDHLGSVRLVLNVATGAVMQQLDYDAWGQVTMDTNPGWQPFGFAGGISDPLSRLLRFGTRDFDPTTGRWMQKDPIGFGGGDSNLYAYAGGDPTNNVDVYGLDWRETVRMWGDTVDYHWSHFATGIADDASFGLGRLLRKRLEDSLGLRHVIDTCSAAYRAGSYVPLAMGLGRLAYAGLARAGAAMAASGAEASEIRQVLKQVFRLGIGGRPSPPTKIYPTDDLLRMAAGRTNSGINALGTSGAAGGAVNAASLCDCK
jgi:RHS repeat-associated protein